MPRRTFVAALLAVTALVVAGLVVLSTRLGEPGPPVLTGDVASRAEAWEQVAPGCSGAAPRCRVPRSVRVDGKVLERVSLQVAPFPVTAGAETSRTQARVELPAARTWLMTGVVDGTAEGYRVEVGDTYEEVASDRPVLLRLPGPQAGAPVSVTAREPRGDGRQFVAVFVWPAEPGRSAGS